MNKHSIPLDRIDELKKILDKRFLKNMDRHPDIDWNIVWKRIEADPVKLWSLNEMEETDGEPDVIGYDAPADKYLICDCSAESPKGRRSLCYDQQALESRKEHKPKDSAEAMSKEMGITILTEDEYRYLQTLGNFDAKTSSWLSTPNEIRKLGGAIFGDWRFGRVFIYHNGAESYYAARGFRGLLKV